MKTDALIAALALDTPAIAPGAVGRRLGLAGAAGGLAAVVLLLAWLGPRPDLHAAMRTADFWIKAGYTAALALGGAMLTARLARPGANPGPAPWLLGAGALAAMWVLGALALARAAPGERAVVWLGHSWMLCPWRIAVIAAPVFAALIWGLKRFAPTRLALAGAAAGLLAGAVGATVYGLACTEASPAFVAVWYTLGVAACAAAGGLSGRWLLRW